MYNYYLCPKCKRNLTDIDFAKKSQYTHSKYINKHICVYCGTRTVIYERDADYSKFFTYLHKRANNVAARIKGIYFGSFIRNVKTYEITAPYVVFYDNADHLIIKMFNTLKKKDEYSEIMRDMNIFKQEDGSLMIKSGTEAWYMIKQEGQEEYDRILSNLKAVSMLVFNAASRYYNQMNSVSNGSEVYV